MNQNIDIFRILNILYRRKDLILAVSLVVITLTVYLAFSLPDVYRSTTLILVTPQRLPANYVASTVTSTITERMQAIRQQVLGRTMLEKVVNEFNLFNSSGSETTIEQRVESLRRKISLSINRNSTFTISFDASDPKTAARVTSRIANLFINENVRVREQQAAGTTSFISTEAERLRHELEEQEQRVNRYRAQYWHELPDNRETNIRSLERLQSELEAGLARLAALQDRRMSLEHQLAESALIDSELSKVGNLTSGETISPAALAHQRRLTELAFLMRKYSEKHPDVIRLKREIEETQVQPDDSQKETKKILPDPSLATRLSLKGMLMKQINDAKAEIASIEKKHESLRPQIATLQARVDNTPLRAIELAKLTRDYEITLRKYQDLLAKSLDSELSENMERTQKGEQFQIVDPANVPQKPIAPNRSRIILLGLLIGIGGAIGLAILLEMLDKSFKSNDDLAGFSGVPLLAVLPVVVTRGDILARRQARAMMVLGSLAVLIVGLLVIGQVNALLLVQ